MNKIILYLSLAGVAFAFSPPVEKPGDAISSDLTYVGNIALAGTISALAISTNYMTITWDKPAENGYPSPDSKFTASLSKSDILSVSGHLIITKQEASDLLKAVDLLTTPEPDYIEPALTSSLINVDALYHYQDNSPAGLRRRADWLEEVAVKKAQRAKDLAWARAVLETWRAKVKGVGK